MAPGLSDHTLCICIGMGSGKGEEAFWKTLQYQIKLQQTIPDECVPSLTSLQVLTIPQQETRTHSLSSNFMHNCELSKSLAPGGETASILKKKKNPKTA